MNTIYIAVEPYISAHIKSKEKKFIKKRFS